MPPCGRCHCRDRLRFKPPFPTGRLWSSILRPATKWVAFVVSRNDAKVIRRLCGAGPDILKLQARLRFQLEHLVLGPEYVTLHYGRKFSNRPAYACGSSTDH